MVLDETAAGSSSNTLGKHVACQTGRHASAVVGETAEIALSPCTFIVEHSL